MKWPFLILITVSLFITCKSAQDKFKDKNYIGAFEDALKDLKKGKDKKENLPVLRKSIAKLTSEYKASYNKYSTLTSLDQKAKVADACIDLVDRYDRAKSFIVADSFHNQKILLEQETNLKQEVGSAFKLNGINALNDIKSSKKKIQARQAMSDLDKAEYYLGSNEEITQLKSDLIKNGTLLVNVEVSQWNLDFRNYEIDNVFRNVEDYSNDKTLQKIYYNTRIPQNELDCNIELRLGSINYDENRTSRTNIFSERIQDGYDTKKDDKGNEVKTPRYIDVKGQVQTTTTILRASVNAQSDVKSYTGNCNWRDNSWSRSVQTQRDQYQLSGDSRAIPSQYRNQPSNNMKSKSQLSDDLLRDVYSVFVNEYFR